MLCELSQLRIIGVVFFPTLLTLPECSTSEFMDLLHKEKRNERNNRKNLWWVQRLNTQLQSIHWPAQIQFAVCLNTPVEKPSLCWIPPLTKPFFLSLPTLLHVCLTDRLHREWSQRLFCSTLRWGTAGQCVCVCVWDYSDISSPQCKPMSVDVWSFRMSLWSHVTGAVGDIL